MSDISGIFQGDLVVKTAIELGLEDMRKNPWLIEDCFKSLAENPLLKKKYGWKEITRAKEFILNNEINIYMSQRLDKVEYPCITISIGNSNEDKSLATLGDQSVCFEDLSPGDIDRSIQYIVKPFKPVSYDSSTGILEIPKDIEEYKYIGQGMFLVDPKTGSAFNIEEKAGDNGIKIAAGSKIPKTEVGVIPRYHIYRARRERVISQEQYNIGCHVHGDTSTLIFLYSIVKYALFRYREGLLESNNFQLSNIQSTDVIKNTSLGVENVYSRWIILSGQVEESWIKTPKRFIEAMDLTERTSQNCEEPTFKPGIKFFSKNAPADLNDEDDLWTTIDE